MKGWLKGEQPTDARLMNHLDELAASGQQNFRHQSAASDKAACE
jgi:hypothetical protein